MSWTDDVACSACRASAWSIVDGVWTCNCGAPMTMSAIKAMQKVRDEEGA